MLRNFFSSTNAIGLTIAATFAGLVSAALAQPVTHPWLSPPIKYAPDAFFTNLKNGKQVKSPFVAKFGMSYWGIAPAENSFERTGHHHLLIDAPMPLPLDKPIDFSHNYRHFGKGQMEALIRLEPGKHTLQLLLADHKHIPTFVFSRKIEIEVVGNTDNGEPEGHTAMPRVEILNLKDGDSVPTLFVVQFHASNLNVATAAPKLAGTGHFQLVVQAAGKTERIDFAGGQTEAWLAPPVGAVTLQLEYVDNKTGAVTPYKSERIRVTVRGKS